MSLPLTQIDLRQRSLRLASLIADDLVSRQTSDGQFKQPDFYAKAFAVNLWTRLDHLRYAKSIERALTALKSDRQDPSYHREFIEYALLDTPDLSSDTVRAVLRNAPNQSPDVANWQLIGLINRQKRRSDILAKMFNLAHFAFILHRYWRKPLFLDRPGSFSGQYHAFCAALLSQSDNDRHQRIAGQAAKMIAKFTGSHGFTNLLGRGAGQNFGTACAVYALMKYGHLDQADAALYRLEDGLLKAGQLPLNLLAPTPLPDKPGPENSQTPGWYSYNRHDDYLAFAGHWLLKASLLQDFDHHNDPCPKTVCSPFVAQYSSEYFHAQMALTGKQGFDVSGAPVIVSGHGSLAQVLLPPTGGEQDVPSLYGPDAHPLPAFGDQVFGQLLGAKRTSQNTIDLTFGLAGGIGHRRIEFGDRCVIIRDAFPQKDIRNLHLLRILVDDKVDLVQTDHNTLTCHALGLRITADAPLQINPQAAYSAAGPATRISVVERPSATLTFCWSDGDA